MQTQAGVSTENEVELIRVLLAAFREGLWEKNKTRDNTKELQAEVPVSDTQEVHHSLKGRWESRR